MNNQEINMGPTVAEYAEKRIQKLNNEIKELEEKRRYFIWLLRTNLTSKMLYSEYVAGRAEPYQRKELDNGKTESFFE